MEFSGHALRRIGERTKLTPVEVHKIFAKKVHCTVGKGVRKGKSSEYHLFYSAPDNRFFVGVTDPITNVLVTILKDGYGLAFEVRVKPRHRLIAKKKWQQFLNKTANQEVPDHGDAEEVLLELLVNHETLHTFPLGRLFKEELRALSFVDSFRDILAGVQEIIQTWRAQNIQHAPAEIKVWARSSKSVGGIEERLRFTSSDLSRLLRRPSSR